MIILLGIFLLIPLGHAFPALLSLEESVRLAAEVSPRVSRVKEQVVLERLREPELLANTDPEYHVSFLRRIDETPNAVPNIFGSRIETDFLETGFSQRWLIGTEADLRWRNSTTDSDASFRVLNPSVESNLSLSIKQHLLKNLWGRPDRALRHKARRHVTAQEAMLIHEKERLAAQVGEVYYEWWFRNHDVRIKESSVHDAERLLAKQREKARYGVLEETDVLQAEVSLAVRKTERMVALSQWRQAQHRLLVILKKEQEWSAISLEPSSEIFVAHDPLTLEDALTTAFQERSDWKAIESSLEAAGFALRLEKLDRLPTVQIVGSMGYAGFSRSAQQAWNDLADYAHPVYSFGLNLVTPLGYSRQKIRIRQSLSQWKIVQLDQQKLRQDIEEQVRSSWENLRLAREMTGFLEKLVGLEREKFLAEEKNFQRGRSSTDILIRFQSDVRKAQSDLLSAKVEEIKAALSLELSMGILSDRFQGFER